MGQVTHAKYLESKSEYFTLPLHNVHITTFMCFKGTNSFTFKINGKHAHVMNVKMNWCNFVFFHVSILVSNYIPLQNSSNPITIKQFKLHKSKYSIDVILLSYYAVMLWFLCKLTYPYITNSIKICTVS